MVTIFLINGGSGCSTQGQQGLQDDSERNDDLGPGWSGGGGQGDAKNVKQPP